MTKSLKINKISIDSEFQLFGINTSLKDYQICILINEFFNLNTRLLSDTNLGEKFSVFGDLIDETKVLIIQNACLDSTHAFPKLKPFEILIVVTNQGESLVEMVKIFEENDDILYLTKVKNEILHVKDSSIIEQLLALL